MTIRTLLKGGRFIDPASGTDAARDLLLEDGRVKAIEAPDTLRDEGAQLLDVSGCWVVPGLIDLHVHLRDPGFEYKEDVESGGRAAAAGGFTTVCCMANTKPVNDTRSVTEYIIRRAQSLSPVHILPIGAVTVGLAGERLAEMGDMKEAGCVAMSDDGIPVSDAGLYRRALEYAMGLGLTVIGHCEDLALTADGVMHEGVASTRAGLSGIPAASETTAVLRDVELARLTGAGYHVAHISTAGAVDAVRRAKSAGLKVTAEVTPHHLVLTDQDVLESGYNTFFKMSPPLRSEADRLAVLAAVADGTIDCVATDHAPHSALEKEVEFAAAANGIVGLETALPIVLGLVREGHLSEQRAIESLTSSAAGCFGLKDVGALQAGAVADVTVIDPDRKWVVSPETLNSRSKNSPFLGQEMQGRARYTFVEGKLVWQDPALSTN